MKGCRGALQIKMPERFRRPWLPRRPKIKNFRHFYSKPAFSQSKSIENHAKFRFRPVHPGCYLQLTAYKLLARGYLQQVNSILRTAVVQKQQNALFFYGHCFQNRAFRIGFGKKSFFPGQNRAQAKLDPNKANSSR